MTGGLLGYPKLHSLYPNSNGCLCSLATAKSQRNGHGCSFFRSRVLTTPGLSSKHTSLFSLGPGRIEDFEVTDKGIDLEVGKAEAERQKGLTNIKGGSNGTRWC